MKMNITMIMVCCSAPLFFCAMERDESQKLLANIQEMQIFHQSHSQNVLTKFERVLHVPIQPKEGKIRCIATAIETITKHDWKKLAKKHPDAYEHAQNSVLWNFTRLPSELQHTIISMMMGYDKDVEQSDAFVGGDEGQQHEWRQKMVLRKMAVDAFVQIPLLHAIDRWSRIVSLQAHNEQLQERGDVELFVTICPYALPIPMNHWVEKKRQSTDKMSQVLVGGIVGMLGGGGISVAIALTSMPVSINSLVMITFLSTTSGTGVGSLLGWKFWPCMRVLSAHGMCPCIPGTGLQYKTLESEKDAAEDEGMCCAQWIKKNK